MLSRGPCLFLFATVMNTLTLSFLSAGSNTSTCWVTLWQACRDKLCIILTQVLTKQSLYCTMESSNCTKQSNLYYGPSFPATTHGHIGWCEFTTSNNKTVYLLFSAKSFLHYGRKHCKVYDVRARVQCNSRRYHPQNVDHSLWYIWTHKSFLWLYHLMIGSWGN